MKRTRAAIILLFAAAAFMLAACQPIPTRKYETIQIGDTYPTVLAKLGVDRLDDDGGPDDFTAHGYNHIERNYIYIGIEGECTQTLRFQFKNYQDYDLENGQTRHEHFNSVQLTNYLFELSSGCNGVVK